MYSFSVLFITLAAHVPARTRGDPPWDGWQPQVRCHANALRQSRRKIRYDQSTMFTYWLQAVTYTSPDPSPSRRSNQAIVPRPHRAASSPVQCDIELCYRCFLFRYPCLTESNRNELFFFLYERSSFIIGIYKLHSWHFPCWMTVPSRSPY